VGGETIAFRPEVEQVLTRLAPRGLPDFEAVVLLLACSRQGSRRRLLDERDPLLTRVLEKSEALLPILEAEPLGRAVLAEMVFEKGGWPRTSPDSAALILEGLRGGLGLEDLEATPLDLHGVLDPHRHTKRLYLHFLGLDAEALMLRLRTGLDRLVSPAPIEPPEAAGTRALITRLLEDPELGGLARLARELMAAAHIPLAVSDPEDLPLGGYSDISNRGPLDRLLASELAHDGPTLAVRIALREALFLRRESPPRTPPRARRVFIDSGIRLWGVPRVFATAAALALAATAEGRAEVAVVRPRGDSLVPVDLRTREGLVEHLGALDAAAHPARALPAFFRALADAGMPADGVLVTHEDVLREPEVQRALAQAADRPIHIAEVSRGGAFRLFLHSRTGRRVLREARIDLDRVLSPRRSPADQPLLDDVKRPDLPVLLTARRFPFLLPCHHVKHIVHAHEETGVAGLLHDGRLVHWAKIGLGARQMSDSIPPGPLLWYSSDPQGRVRLLVGPEGARGPVLVSTGVSEGEVRRVLLETGAQGVTGAGGHRDTVFLVYPGLVEGFDARTGQRTGALAISSDMRWERDRFFRHRRSGMHHALSSDGTGARLEPIKIGLVKKNVQCITCFDRDLHDGPWAVTERGTIVSAATYQEVELPHGLEAPVRVVDISPGGRFITLSSPRRGTTRVVDVEERRSWGLHSHAELGDDHFARLLATPRTIRHRFRRIGFDWRRGGVYLFGKTSDLSLQPTEGSFLAWSGGTCSGASRTAEFRPVRGLPGRRYGLQVAEFKGGSRAFLDSRGLLHLKSSDTSIPEVAVVITDGSTALWSSDGRISGPPVFVGDAECADSDRIHDHVRAFAARLP
jgi:hypothetical protein